MRLLSYCTPTQSSYGVFTDQGIMDLKSHFGAAYPTLKTFIAGQKIDEAQTTVQQARQWIPLETIQYLPVIPDPGKIICVGLNYEDHRIETDHEPSGHPTLFARFPSSQVGHQQALQLPINSTQFDYEAELAVVIGKPTHHVAKDQALSCIAGYACYNDGSIRDWQQHTSQFFSGKNFPATGAFGPYLVTVDEVGDPSDLSIELRLNGEVLQSARTSQMIFSIPRLIAYISSFTPLEPGDVIVTGTPGGVGFTRTPPIFMKAGDHVEVEVEKVGILNNTVLREATQAA